MANTRCGCPGCKGRPVPTGRVGWKALKNRKGFSYGSTKKVTKGNSKVR